MQGKLILVIKIDFILINFENGFVKKGAIKRDVISKVYKTLSKC